MYANDNENEIDNGDKTAFQNFMQGLHNIDTAMEAMIDNYTDGVEHLGEENGLQENENSIFNHENVASDKFITIWTFLQP